MSDSPSPRMRAVLAALGLAPDASPADAEAAFARLLAAEAPELAHNRARVVVAALEALMERCDPTTAAHVRATLSRTRGYDA